MSVTVTCERCGLLVEGLAAFEAHERSHLTLRARLDDLQRAIDALEAEMRAAGIVK